MIVYLIALPLLLLAAILDASVFSHLSLFNGQVSLLLLLLVSWGLMNELGESLPWAFIGGIFADLLSVTPLGTSSLAYTLALIVVASLFGQVRRRNLILPMLAVAITVVIYHAVALGVLLFEGWRFALFSMALTWTLPTLGFNMLAMLVVFRVFGAIVEFFRPPKPTL